MHPTLTIDDLSKLELSTFEQLDSLAVERMNSIENMESPRVSKLPKVVPPMSGPDRILLRLDKYVERIR